MKLAYTNSGKLANPHEPHGIFVHALHKSATMFLFRFFKAVAEKGQYRYFSPNLSPSNVDTLAESIGECFCCCPVRSFEIEPAAFSKIGHLNRIFHIRDPRDMLVSEYFSFGWIHASSGGQLEKRKKEIQAMTVDEYVLEQPNFSAEPLEMKLAPLLETSLTYETRTTRPSRDETHVLVRYEDLVGPFDRWLSIVLRPFRIRSKVWNRWRWYRSFCGEFRVPRESMTHKRRIVPGDHRDKLKSNTIKVLNRRFADFLARFRYA